MEIEGLRPEEVAIVEKTSFSLYGSAGAKTVPAVQLFDPAIKGELIARMENSGSEGYYVEVARWNDNPMRWERFAFEKFLGGEYGNSCTAAACAREMTELLNRFHQEEDAPLIHHMPNWGS